MSSTSSSMSNSAATSYHGIKGTVLYLWSFLLSSTAFREGAKLLLIGSVLEMTRRFVGILWTSFVDALFITAQFEDRDETFTWMMFWLSKQPKWNYSRSIRVTTTRYGQSGVADQLPGEAEGKEIAQLRRLAYVPSHNKTLYMWYQRTWMSVTLTQTQGDMWNRRGDERLTISLFTRNVSRIDDLLLEAKRTYKKDSEGRINIYISDPNNDWILTSTRPRRPLSSVVIDKGIKLQLLNDAKDFMASERWYAERGIPWRRGYLLHGSPGSGKTSLIHSLAGELGLDIYVISLSKKNLDDSTLNELISKLPARSIALMEDIDAAFFRGITREEDAGGPGGVPLMPGQPPGEYASPSSASSITLSGLLGAIDGVAAQEGRLLFATTNKFNALDPALIRPGRLDIHVRFDNAKRQQVAMLFRCFFPPSSEDGPSGDEGDDYKIFEEDPNENDSGFDSSNASIEKDKQPNGSPIYSVNSSVQCNRLPEHVVNSLARKFAARVPEGEFSMAEIQGLLMQYKSKPYQVVEEVEKWVAEARREKAERSATILQSSHVKRSAMGIVVPEIGQRSDEIESQFTPEEEPIEEKIPVTVPCAWWPMGGM